MIYNIPAALTELRPNAQWTLRGETYAGLEWNDSKQTKPTESEVNAKCAELKTAYDNKKYQRDRKPEYPSGKRKSKKQRINTLNHEFNKITPRKWE